MTKPEENKLSMYKAVNSVANESKTIIETIPALSGAITRFGANIESINATDIALNNSTSGKTGSKEKAENAMLDVLIPLASSLHAYANKANKEELKVKSKVTRSYLKSIRDNELITKTQMIRDLLNENLAALADYSITAVKLTELDEKLSTYQGSIGSKETSFATKGAARISLSQLFDDTDNILKNEIDTLVENFKNGNKTFYDKYWSARTIKDLGLGHDGDDTPPTPPAPEPSK